MPCYSPLKGYYSAEIGKSGKRGITFDRGASFSGVGLSLPCGQCVGCRLERSRQWAVRCMHEKRVCYNDGYPSSFVTLTYDDESLRNIVDEYGVATLVKRDLQLFMKRLRKKTGNGVRFYACGEYGETSLRPHYHVLLFNRDFSDKRKYQFGDVSHPLFTSRALDSLWSVDGRNLGRAVVGEVTFDSCAYVARYVVDKITGDRSAEHYQGRVPEFTVMSRRPGIGSEYYARYGSEAYAHDAIVMNGVTMRPPRFYDTRYELVDSARMVLLKRKRRRAALLFRSDNTPDRRRVREVFELKKLYAKKKGRVMSVIRYYSVRDKKAEAFMTPFQARTDAEAIRSFTDACSDDKSPFYRYPEDFVLYRVAEWNETIGSFVPVNGGAMELISGFECRSQSIRS